MNFAGMKLLDRFAGPLLCRLVRLSYLPAPARPQPEPIRRILVIKFWGMGGLILTAPLLRALRAGFPQAEIHLATLAGNRELAEWLGLADRLLLLDLSGSPLRIPATILRFLNQVRRTSADAALDLEYLTRFSALVAGLSRAPLRVGFAGNIYRGNLHNRLVPFRADRHVTENFLHFARSLDEKLDLAPAVSPRSREEERASAAELLAAQGIGPGETLIAVNPHAGALALERRWPAAHFAALLDQITQARLGRVVLIGAPEEACFVADLHGRLQEPSRVQNLAGRLSFAELKGLLARADLLITNDSGPLHLAALLGTPTLSFFGPETPRLYAPRGPEHTALYQALPCSPCIHIETAKTVRCVYSRPECVIRITPEEAWAAVQERLLASRRSSPN